MEYHQDSSYQCQIPVESTSASSQVQGVVRCQSNSETFPNSAWTGFINLFGNVCKSTKSQGKPCLLSSLLRRKAMLISVLVIMILVGSCDAVPVPALPARSSRSLSGNSSNRGSFNQNPSVSPTPSPSSTLQNLHGLDSGSSLSIMSPLDILRQNLVMEILRRKQRQSKQRQMQLNKEILDRIG